MVVSAAISSGGVSHVSGQRDSFNYDNAYVFNPETRRFDRYNNNPNRAYEGRYNSNTGRWEPDYYDSYNPSQRRYDNDGRWPAAGRYEFENAKWWNPSTGRYEYTTTNRYDGRYGNYDDRRRYYNQQTSRYEYDYPKRYYNATTGRYEDDYYYNNNRRWFNPATGRYENDYYDHRYNVNSGRYNDRYVTDRYANDEFGRRQPNDFYGRGSVEPVHVPKVRYDNEQHWQTVRDARVTDADGYHFSYETENAIRSAEDARVIHKGTPHEALAKTGFYEYVGDDGKTYRVDWTADENGFHASVRFLIVLILIVNLFRLFYCRVLGCIKMIASRMYDFCSICFGHVKCTCFDGSVFRTYRHSIECFEFYCRCRELICQRRRQYQMPFVPR